MSEMFRGLRRVSFELIEHRAEYLVNSNGLRHRLGS